MHWTMRKYRRSIEGHRADRRRILLRRHRFDRARLARSRTCFNPSSRPEPKPRLSAARPSSECSSAPPAKVNSATAGAARFSLPVQPAAVRRLHDPRRVRADRVRWLMVCRFIAGHRPRRRAAARLRLCRRIFAEAHPRPHPGDRALHRRRLRVADRNRVRAALRQPDRLRPNRYGAASGSSSASAR